MSDKYVALRAAAENATPGPWEYYHGNTSIEYNVQSMEEDQGSVLYVNSGDFTQKQTDRNGEFIAAANPATILELLAERDADKRRIEELSASHSKLHEGMAAIYNAICADGASTSLSAILTFVKRAFEESKAAAGISLEIEGSDCETRCYPGATGGH